MIVDEVNLKFSDTDKRCQLDEISGPLKKCIATNSHLGHMWVPFECIWSLYDYSVWPKNVTQSFFQIKHLTWKSPKVHPSASFCWIFVRVFASITTARDFSRWPEFMAPLWRILVTWALWFVAAGHPTSASISTARKTSPDWPYEAQTIDREGGK